MQSHPGEVAAKAIHTIEIVRVELEERTIESPLMEVLQINLKRDVGKDSYNQRDKQARNESHNVFPRADFTQSEECARAGDDQNQR